MRAPETQVKERVVFVCIIQPKRSALLKAAAAKRDEKGFVRNMVHMVFALQKDATKVFELMVSASNMVATGSALGYGATRPLKLEEGVASTCTPRKSAR